MECACMILVLLKIVSVGEYSFLKDLSSQLGISPSKIMESLNRSVLAGLISQDKNKGMQNIVHEFFIHGLPYVFPQKTGAIVLVMPTAHSAPPLNKAFKGNEMYVCLIRKEK